MSSSGSTAEETEENLRRRPFVSRHRKALDHIAVDSTESRRHTIPETPLRVRRGQEEESIGEAGPRDRLMNICFEEKPASISDWVSVFLPSWKWLRVYDWRTTLFSDVIAGLTVGVMIIPQSMSYAKLAGLPVEYGLYSALVPIYAYALFGSSRQLAVGPVAIISLLLSTGLGVLMDREGFEVGDPDYQNRYNQLAVQISFLVGITYIVMGLLRLGFVTIFLSHAVISGFTSGAAVIIGLSQIKFIFGYDIKRSDHVYEIIQSVFENISGFSYKTFLMGSLSIAALVTMKNVGKTYKKLKWMRAMGPLTVTTFTIVITVVLDLDKKGIPVVGSIPKGLPSVSVGDWTPIERFGEIYLIAISIAIVGFMESIAIAKQLASKHKYEIDSSTELMGLGMANLLGGAFQAYPITGSFSRSAVNNDSGARSGVSGLVTATLVGLVLLLLTFVFERLPLSVLAAIVISGVLGLFDHEEARYLYKVHKFDFCVWMTACLGTMIMGVEIGLAIAVGLSLLIVVYESAYPHTSVLGRLPGTSYYRSVKQYPDAECYDGIVIVRIDAPLYFANALNIREKIRKYRVAAEKEIEAHNGSVRYVILECSPVSHVDTSALHELENMNTNHLSRGQQLIFSNPNQKVMHRFRSSGLVEKVGSDHFFPCLHDAVSWCLHEMDTEAISLHESVTGGVDVEEGDLDTEESPLSDP